MCHQQSEVVNKHTANAGHDGGATNGNFRVSLSTEIQNDRLSKTSSYSGGKFASFDSILPSLNPIELNLST